MNADENQWNTRRCPIGFKLGAQSYIPDLCLHLCLSAFICVHLRSSAVNFVSNPTYTHYLAGNQFPKSFIRFYLRPSAVNFGSKPIYPHIPADNMFPFE
jgi:hypothetical protein